MTTDEAPRNRLLEGYFEDLARLARLSELDADCLDGGSGGWLSPHERALLVPLGLAHAPDATSPATVTAPPSRRAIWVGIGLALAGLALLFVQPWSVEPAHDGWIAKSGETFAVQVLVERDGAPVKIRSGDQVRTGERFGLFLDSPTRGYGAVWFVEANAPATLLFPRIGAGRLNAGVGFALPDGGAFTQTDQACEWIVGLHAPDPIDRDAIVAALRAAKRGPDCQLTFAAPQGVRVSTVALRRTEVSR